MELGWGGTSDDSHEVAGGPGSGAPGGGRRVTRRGLFRWAGSAGMLGLTAGLTGCVVTPGGGGVTVPGVGGSVRVAEGFTVRLIAASGQPVAGLTWPLFPDGAATFEDPEVPGGWYLVVNSEVPVRGGVASIRFAPDGTVVGARRLLSDTSLNCAGGATPWGTWLSCEEFDLGLVWECDPTGRRPSVRRSALGAFAHEAAAVAADDRVYLTEDRRDGGLYRFTPDTAGDLSSGLLEVATGSAPGPAAWVPVPDPTGFPVPTRHQVPGTMVFDGGEGIDTAGDSVWFTTKGDDRVWEYSLSGAEVTLRFQGGAGSDLSGVDNLLVDRPSGALLVAEDGGDMQVVAIVGDTTVVLAQVLGQEGSEIAGPCFDPSGERLYFSSQRAPVGDEGGVGAPAGATYEVSGPFGPLLGRP